METNGSNTKQEEQATSQATPGPPKITSEVKVKDPRRVAQGKRLAAISREAKARKAREREMSIRKEEVEKCERSERKLPVRDTPCNRRSSSGRGRVFFLPAQERPTARQQRQRRTK